MDIFLEAHKGRYLIPEDLKGKLPETVILSLGADQKALRIYSEKSWKDVLNEMQEESAPKSLMSAITKAMKASVYKTTTESGYFEIPEKMLEKSGLQSKSLCIEYDGGMGAAFPVLDKRFGDGLPAELVFSGEYYIRNDDGVFIVNFEGPEPELWFEHRGVRQRVVPQNSTNNGQHPFGFERASDHERLIAKYEAFFSRGIRVLQSFSDGKEPLLDFCMRYGLPAVELAEDCPALAFVAAKSSFCEICTPGFNFYQQLPEKKRTQILRIAGYPNSKWVSKLFRNIPVADCHGLFFHDLKNLLLSVNQEKQQVLTHLKVVNHSAVQILLDDDFFQLFHRSFFDEVSALAGGSEAADNFWQLYQLKGTLLEAVSQGETISALRSVKDLVTVHEQVVHWMKDQRYLKKIETIVFPEGPFPELLLSEAGKNHRKGIFPITSGRDLWLEGKTMHHCIAGYADAISRRGGRFYAFHVDLPDEEPATLTVISKGGATWFIHELRGVRNVKVPKRVYSFVKGWLDKQTYIY